MRLAAIAAFALVGLAVAQTIRPIPDTQARIVGQIPAEWWTYTLLSTQPDGTIVTSFAVPTDRFFVLTHSSGINAPLANGIPVEGFEVTRIAENHGTRVVIQPGTVLTAPPSGGVPLWGYLEPVR